MSRWVVLVRGVVKVEPGCRYFQQKHLIYFKSTTQSKAEPEYTNLNYGEKNLAKQKPDYD